MEPVGLLADLLFALGYALWTGAVVVVLLDVVPKVKRRQFKRTLEATSGRSARTAIMRRPNATYVTALRVLPPRQVVAHRRRRKEGDS